MADKEREPLLSRGRWALDGAKAATDRCKQQQIVAEDCGSVKAWPKSDRSSQNSNGSSQRMVVALRHGQKATDHRRIATDHCKGWWRRINEAE